MMMRGLKGATIVFVDNFAGPGLGGGEVHMFRLIDACLEQGMYVHVICCPDTYVEQVARERGVTVARYHLSRRNLLRTASRIRKYLKRSGADIVHSNGFLTNLLARMAGGVLKTRVVNSVHCLPDAGLAAGESRLVASGRRFADRLTFGRVDILVSVSEAIWDQLAAMGLDPRRVRVIHSGVDVAEIERDATSGRMMETAPGLVVGVAGRLEKIKGLESFLRAAAILRDRDDVRFLIVGDGPDRGRLEHIANELGVADRVDFLGYTSNLAVELAAMDVFVMPSLTEGFGLVAVEAMALGKPVIATRVGGLIEVVEDGLTGILVPPGDPKALASAIGRLLDSEDARRSMGEVGRRRVRERFTAKRMVDEHLDVYRGLLRR